jgi:hypothetical protein
MKWLTREMLLAHFFATHTAAFFCKYGLLLHLVLSDDVFANCKLNVRLETRLPRPFAHLAASRRSVQCMYGIDANVLRLLRSRNSVLKVVNPLST